MEQQTLGLLDSPRLPGKEWDNTVDFPTTFVNTVILKKGGKAKTHLPISVDGKTSKSIRHLPAWRGEYRGNLVNAGKAGK